MISRSLIGVTVALVLTCFFASPAFVAAQDPPGYSLVWSDDFNGNSLDTSLWTASFSTNPTNNSLHAYLPQHVAVSNGNMVITSTNTPYQNLPYRSGHAISTSAQKYGRWEVRAKLPATTGMWPAIWLLPDTNQYPWPSGGEIDIMEARGNDPFRVSSAFHYGTNPPFNHQFTYDNYATGENFQAGFHTYAAEWDQDEVRYYVDGNLYHTVTDASVNNSISNAGSMNLIINTAIGGDFLANPNSSTVWPQQFLIDSVKVYQPTPVALAPFVNGGFDDQGGSLDDWTDFGNSIGNVSVDNEAVREGTHSLKLYGQFNGAVNYSGAYQGIGVTAGQEVRAISESFIRSQDSISGTGNAVEMKVDYFSTVGGSVGGASYISSDLVTIANGSTANDVWNLEELRSTAPAGAVEARVAFVFVQPGNQGGAVHVDNVMFGVAGDYTFVWDGGGNGSWNDDRWNGGYNSPDDFDNVIIHTNRVTAAGAAAANDVSVQSGVLELAGVLTSPQVNVDAAGSLAGAGLIQGAVNLSGTLLVDANQTLNVTQSVSLAAGAELALEADYNEPRGTKTGDFVIISGSSVSGTFATPGGAGSHMGDGRFLWSIDYQATQIVADIYSALMGDANGDGVVDVSDFNIWNVNRFATNADWTMGDFNSDGMVNDADFALWNANRFTETTFAIAVPEPSGFLLGLLGLLLCTALRRRSA